MTTNDASLAQRSTEKLVFDHRDMDYYLSWVMGREIYAGSDADECYETAGRITDGDAASWRREWLALAERVEAEAQAALDRGENDGARAAYLRACTYYRAPLFIMSPHEATFSEHYEKMRACFRQAAALFASPVEPITVPYQEHQLTGYAWGHGDSRDKRPTLVVFGGIETFAEDCYFMVGPAGPERGYNLITVDLPGQGMTPNDGLHFGASMERPVRAVLEAVAQRPTVDADRLAVFGFSWGGHIAFKAGRHLPEVKAIIANPPMPDVFRAALAQQQGHSRSDPITQTVFRQIAWRMGLKISLNPADIARRFGKAYDYLVNGRANPRKIPCPALCIAGEAEAPITLKIARECEEQLPHPKSKVVILTHEDGGAAHCQVDNLALPNRIMFDWLDEVTPITL